LESAEQQPGLVRVTAQDDLLSGATPVFKRGDTGWLMKSGRLFAVLVNGANAPNPFFAIGAFVQ
jgi:hypothetical protein